MLLLNNAVLEEYNQILRCCIITLQKNEEASRIFVTLFRFDRYGLATNKFSMDIVQTLSKKHHFSIGRSAKLAEHVQFLTIISHPGIKRIH